MIGCDRRREVNVRNVNIYTEQECVSHMMTGEWTMNDWIYLLQQDEWKTIRSNCLSTSPMSTSLHKWMNEHALMDGCSLLPLISFVSSTISIMDDSALFAVDWSGGDGVVCIPMPLHVLQRSSWWLRHSDKGDTGFFSITWQIAHRRWMCSFAAMLTMRAIGIQRIYSSVYDQPITYDRITQNGLAILRCCLEDNIKRRKKQCTARSSVHPAPSNQHVDTVSNTNRLGVILAFLRKFWISRTWSGKHICIHMGKGFRANGTRNQQKVTLSGNGHKQFMPVFSSGSQRFFLHWCAYTICMSNHTMLWETALKIVLLAHIVVVRDWCPF